MIFQLPRCAPPSPHTPDGLASRSHAHVALSLYHVTGTRCWLSCCGTWTPRASLAPRLS